MLEKIWVSKSNPRLTNETLVFVTPLVHMVSGKAIIRVFPYLFSLNSFNFLEYRYEFLCCTSFLLVGY